MLDNCSTDATAEQLAPFVAAPNVNVVHATTHVGMAANWNRAVLASRGTWVTVLNADDELLPAYYGSLGPELDRSESSALSQTAESVAGDHQALFGPTTRTALTLDEFVGTLGTAVCISTTAFRRQYFDSVGGFDAEVGSLLDFDFFVRIAHATGLPISALGSVGGRYFPDRGATWARHEETGEARQIILRWIGMRRAMLGPRIAEVAASALAVQARSAARTYLFSDNPVAASQAFTVAAGCTHGLARAESRVMARAARWSPAFARALLRAYSKLRRAQ